LKPNSFGDIVGYLEVKTVASLPCRGGGLKTRQRTARSGGLCIVDKPADRLAEVEVGKLAKH